MSVLTSVLSICVLQLPGVSRLRTLHELVGSAHVIFAGADEPQEQRVGFVSKSILHTFGELISITALSDDGAQLLH